MNGSIRLVFSFVLPVSLLLGGCAGAGPYGHAPEYVELGAEEDALEGVTEVGYEDVRRAVADYAASKISWFGVVTGVDDNRGLVEMTFRTLTPRNVCANERDSSCRVTISAREGGVFAARIQMRPEDENGPDRIWIGSLLRIVGQPEPELSPANDGPVLRAEYYRHWPRGAYVTTNARGSMRR